MSSRRSIGLPITLAVVMIVLLVALTIGWVLINVAGALREDGSAALYWTVMSIGTAFLALVLGGVVWYLVMSIKVINLSQRQSNFIDSVTHELKSPIASLKLLLQTISLRPMSDDRREEYYRLMLDDVERLDMLINHVLDAGRMEKGKLAGVVEELRIDKVISECAEIVAAQHRLPADAITLRIESSVVRARHVELTMLFRNLLDNAVKYGGDPPEVVVESVQPGDFAVVRIIDNGPGIPVRHRHKIFGRFVRLGLELQRQTKGTGLGLYIVHTLVRQLNGQIEVSDRPDGTCSVFQVSLPATRADHDPALAETADLRESPAAGEANVVANEADIVAGEADVADSPQPLPGE